MRYHLMGVCGIGVSGLARVLKAQGHEVSGCDQNPSAIADILVKEGITVIHGEHASHCDDIDCLVLSTAIPHNHPEVLAAQARGIPVRRRIDVLADMMQTLPSIGIVGTHGKTTTSSMVSCALLGAGEDISALIGGIVPELGNSNARTGSGHLVAEVDESDPNFQNIHCKIAVLTNIEDDHISPDGKAHNNYHASYEGLLAAFRRYLEQAETVLYCYDWAKVDLTDFTRGCKNTLSYGLSPKATYSAQNVKPQAEGVEFDVYYQGQKLCHIHLGFPGSHNIQNALAALATTHLIGRDIEQAARALEAFKGAGRRWQKIGEREGAIVIDDYAHNPTKVEAALQAAKQTLRRVRVIFQPHRHRRTAQSWERYAQILQNADEVILLDIYGAGEPPIEGISSHTIEQRMHELGYQNVFYAASHDEAIALALKGLSQKDLIITMGAGDVTQIAPRLVVQA